MMEAEPTPDSIARCGGCKKEYPRAEVTKLKFIGRGDLYEDGDNRLAYYNCLCDEAGTFCIELPDTATDIAINSDLADNVDAAEAKMAPRTAEEHYIHLRK